MHQYSKIKVSIEIVTFPFGASSGLKVLRLYHANSHNREKILAGFQQIFHLLSRNFFEYNVICNNVESKTYHFVIDQATKFTNHSKRTTFSKRHNIIRGPISISSGQITWHFDIDIDISYQKEYVINFAITKLNASSQSELLDCFDDKIRTKGFFFNKQKQYRMRLLLEFQQNSTIIAFHDYFFVMEDIWIKYLLASQINEYIL